MRDVYDRRWLKCGVVQYGLMLMVIESLSAGRWDEKWIAVTRLIQGNNLDALEASLQKNPPLPSFRGCRMTSLINPKTQVVLDSD